VSEDVQKRIAKAYKMMIRKTDTRKKNKRKGKAHWKPKVNYKVLLRTQPVSDTTAGITASSYILTKGLKSLLRLYHHPRLN